jgi:hypothetical protein
MKLNILDIESCWPQNFFNVATHSGSMKYESLLMNQERILLICPKIERLLDEYNTVDDTRN